VEPPTGVQVAQASGLVSAGAHALERVHSAHALTAVDSSQGHPTPTPHLQRPWGGLGRRARAGAQVMAEGGFIPDTHLY